MNPAIGHENKGLYQFGVFRLDVNERVLMRAGERISLPPKAFDTLLLLVQNSGHALSKDQLLKTLWPDSFVEENNLTQQISQLRRALSDGMDGQSYIETVPKLGYRFLPEVREIVEGDASAPLSTGAVMEVSKRTSTHIVLREEVEEEEGSNQTSETHSFAAKAVLATARLSPSWKLALASLALTAVSVTGVFSYRAMRSSSRAERISPTASTPVTAPVKTRHSIVVLGFKNLSGRAEEDWLSRALAEMLTTELSAGGQLRLVSGEEVQRIKSDLELDSDQSLAKPTLNQIRNRVGVDIIVSGTYVEVGRGANSQIRLDLQLQDAAGGQTVFATAVTGRTRELFALVSRSGGQLRSKLGASMLSDLEGAQDQASMPSTTEAARYYSQGLYQLRVFDARAAQELLTMAVSADQNFALGHAALASAWSELGYDEKAKTEARRALDLSLSLSPQHHLLIAGQYSELTRDWSQAVATYQQLLDLFPDSVDYGLLLANAQTSAGKGSEALATLERLRRLPPPANQDPQIDLAQAAAAESLGDFKQSLEASERATRNGEALSERLLVARAWTKKSWALRRLGRPQEATAGLLEAKKSFSKAGNEQGVGSAVRLLAGAQSEQGDYAQAEKSFQEAIAIFRRIGDQRALAMSVNGLGIVHYERGDLDAAKALYKQYLEIEREVGSKVNTAGALGNIANVEDAQGNLADARRLNEESLKIFAEVGDQRAIGTALGNIAILLYEQGDLEGARKKFEEALELKRKIGYQRGIAYDLAGLSEVFRAEGDLVTAEQKQEEALAIRNQLGAKSGAAASRLYLAVLALEDHRAAEAEKIAAETAQEFHAEKSAADEAAAEEVRARSLLALDKLLDAEGAVNRARTLARGITNLPLGFDITATSARIKIATKRPPNATIVANAKKDLESSLAVAHRCGYLEYEYKLKLALGEIELESGDRRQGRARLEALGKDASEKGFGLIAHDAAATLKPLSVHQR